VLVGYTLCQSLSPKPVKSLKKFYSARFATLYPQYLFALLLSFVNLFLACSPNEYNEKFTFQSEYDLSCQSMPVKSPYIGSVISSGIVFGLGLQAWPFAIPLTFWMLFYAWFSSVYYFIILVFPPMHNMLVRARLNKKKLLIWFAFSTFGTYLTCIALMMFYSLPDWTKAHDTETASDWGHNFQNFYALCTMLFPPYWVPVAFSGMVSYFLYDAYRPSEKHGKKLKGLVCDSLTVLFLAFHVLMFIYPDFPYPDFANDIDDRFGPDENSGIKRYIWSVVCSRVKVPLICLWIALLSMPSVSYTARFLEQPLFAETLGPAAYGCFLYHQIVGQWYFLATRKRIWDWWTFRKEYYWFSPKPMPGAWYEFFFVVMLVTIFSMFVNTFVATHLSKGWAMLGTLYNFVTGASDQDEDIESALDLIIATVEELTGGSPDIDTSMALAEMGLSSVGLPAFVDALNSKDPSIHIGVLDLANLDTIEDLVTLIEDKQHDAARNAGVGVM